MENKIQSKTITNKIQKHINISLKIIIAKKLIAKKLIKKEITKVKKNN